MGGCGGGLHPEYGVVIDKFPVKNKPTQLTYALLVQDGFLSAHLHGSRQKSGCFGMTVLQRQSSAVYA